MFLHRDAVKDIVTHLYPNTKDKQWKDTMEYDGKMELTPMRMLTEKMPGK